MNHECGDIQSYRHACGKRPAPKIETRFIVESCFLMFIQWCATRRWAYLSMQRQLKGPSHRHVFPVRLLKPVLKSLGEMDRNKELLHESVAWVWSFSPAQSVKGLRHAEDFWCPSNTYKDTHCCQ